MTQAMRYCADAIILFEGKFVIIERLSKPLGLALPGGGIELGENKEIAAVREVKEETGLTLTIDSWLPKIYDREGRDERWPSTSYVAVGTATGTVCNEEGKTKVLLLSKEEVVARAKEFAFDHYEIFCDYLKG